MSDHDRRLDQERRARRAMVAAATKHLEQLDEPSELAEQRQQSQDDDDRYAKLRVQQQQTWVDIQVRQAMDRGEFDNPPGAGKPIRGLGATHDPDWWVKGLIERERITGVLPPALALRKEDAGLTEQIDQQATEPGVRELVEDFNRRVVAARRQLTGGPPVITPTRDVDAEVAGWRERREERRRLRAVETTGPTPPATRKASNRPRSWLRRRSPRA